MTTMPVYEMVDTWNAAGTVFTAIGMNVTDNLSASGSMLIDLQVGGTSQFHVTKSGSIHGKRFNYNIASANAPIVSVSNYSLTGSNADSLFDLAGTWNTSGTPTALKLNVTDTASAAGSLLLDLQVGGVSRFSVRKDGRADIGGLNINFGTYGGDSNWWSANNLNISSSSVLSFGAADIVLRRDAANILAQRNGTNAQAFRVYNTYTDASNYERGFARWVGNEFQIGVESAGTGVGRTLALFGQGVLGLSLGSSTFNVHGRNLLFATDNTNDIGASGANRPRNLFVAGRAIINTLTVGLGGQTAVATNTALGFGALNSASLTGTSNVGVGYQTLNSNTTGGNNSAVGVNALLSNTTASNNSAVGSSVLFSNTTGSNNSATGAYALQNNTTGGDNSAFGYAALNFNTTASDNSAVGRDALFSNTTGASNSAVGRSALRSSNSNNNSALGFEAGRRLSGANNVLAGYRAGYGLSRGVSTLGAITGGSGYTDGTYNGVTLTRSSGSWFDTAPTANITVSGGAVTAVTIVTAGTGFTDTTIVLSAAASTIGGTGSGFSVVVSALTGANADNNTLLGYQAGDNLTEGSNNLIIGYDVDADSATGSNQVNIADRYFHDRIRLLERTSDPAKPAEGNMVVWLSDGTGLGDDGDVIISSTAGGVTNYAILFDHSAGTLWP